MPPQRLELGILEDEEKKLQGEALIILNIHNFCPLFMKLGGNIHLMSTLCC